MHIFIPSWGSSGDVLPSIAIGWELRQRGYPVTFIGNPYYEAQVKMADLSFVPVGTRADHESLMTDADIFDRSKKTAEQFYAEHVFSHIEAFYETCMDIFDPGHSIVLRGEYGSYTAAEKLDIPFVAIACSPATGGYRSKYDPIHPERMLPEWSGWFAKTGRRLALLYRLNDLRHGTIWRRSTAPANLQLPDDHPIALLRARAGLPTSLSQGPRKILCMWPDWFASPQPDWPDEFTIAGFPFYPRPNFEAGKSSVKYIQASEPGPIVFTTGSIASSQIDFYTMAVEACRLLHRPALLVTPNEDHIPRDLPDYVKHVSFAPFDELFGCASLVVHHGGIGTASYALAAGIPQIVMPMRGDQFDNGNRLVRLGIAQMLSPRQTSGAKLARTIEFMLTSDHIIRQCGHWQSRVDIEAGLQIAADSVEKIARSSGVQN